MMRKAGMSLACLLMAGSVALGGTVSFDPATQEVLPGEAARFDISVTSTTLEVMDTINLLVGSHTAFAGFAFDFDQAYIDSATFDPDATPFGVYASDLNLAANNLSGGWTAPILIGTLTFDTTGLAEGKYDVMVSTSTEFDLVGTTLTILQDGFAGDANIEAAGSFTVVPEPATLAMLGIGGIATVLRRRRTA